MRDEEAEEEAIVDDGTAELEVTIEEVVEDVVEDVVEEVTGQEEKRVEIGTTLRGKEQGGEGNERSASISTFPGWKAKLRWEEAGSWCMVDREAGSSVLSWVEASC